LNVTDDSFYDGNRYTDEHAISKQAEKMIGEGADIIDIGGYSSRPGAKDIGEDIELKRVLKGIKAVQSVSTEIPISVDTFRSAVARSSVEEGAAMINDISGGNLDSRMFRTVCECGVPYILMHMVGSPQNMTSNAVYDNLLTEMLDYFSKKLQELTQIGIKDVIIDVGFGFSKTFAQNYDLLASLELFKVLNAPLLVGISRKSMIYRSLKINPENALNGTTAINTFSLLKGASIIRVHDVKEAKEVIDLIINIDN
jgi:dihydropteroate synthase